MCFIHGYIQSLNKVSTLFSLNVLYCIISFSDQIFLRCLSLALMSAKLTLYSFIFFYMRATGANSNQLVHKTFLGEFSFELEGIFNGEIMIILWIFSGYFGICFLNQSAGKCMIAF